MPAPLYPPALAPGARIVVLAPSSGVEPTLHPRLDLVLGQLRAHGFVVEEGLSLRTQQHGASAPAEARAAELMRTLLRDDVAAIYPPWGGELAIELLPRLDWAALQQARPKWLIGYSDTSTLLVPITLQLGWASAHGTGLMDLVPAQADALSAQTLAHLATPAGGRFMQHASSHWQKHWTDFAAAPALPYQLSEPTCWRALNRPAGQPLTLQGRLLGGCLDTLMHLAGTPHGPVPSFTTRCAADGVLLYLENAELPPPALLRALTGLRLAGWFDGLAGLLMGRSSAPDAAQDTGLSSAQALQQAIGDLPCPVLLDLDIGHQPPQMLLVNGALASLHWDGQHGGCLQQTLA